MKGQGSVSRGKLAAGLWQAVRQLNPKSVAAEARRPVTVAAVGPQEFLEAAAGFLLGDRPELYDAAAESLLLLTAPLDEAAHRLLARCDVVLCSGGEKQAIRAPTDERVFELVSADDLPAAAERIVREPSLQREQLALARTFPGLRSALAREIVQTTSVENAVFVAYTALGNIFPRPLLPLTSVAEALGDTVVLTANQVRMVFKLAAAFDRPVGFREQMPEVAAIIGAAFGWRSAARLLISKLPAGSGVMPKAGIAFAGTWAVGDAVAHYYTTGQRPTRQEIQKRFEEAREIGRAAAEAAFAVLRKSPGTQSAPPESPESSESRETS